MASNRNRTAGHKWERDSAAIQRDFVGYKDLITSRQGSRLRDSQKVDLCNADEDANGRLPYNIQCKTLSKAAPYHKLLSELEEFNGREQINVVFHKMTRKSEGGKFLPMGEFAILNLDDFHIMQRRILQLEKFVQSIDSTAYADESFINKII